LSADASGDEATLAFGLSSSVNIPRFLPQDVTIRMQQEDEAGTLTFDGHIGRRRPLMADKANSVGGAHHQPDPIPVRPRKTAFGNLRADEGQVHRRHSSESNAMPVTVRIGGFYDGGTHLGGTRATRGGRETVGGLEKRVLRVRGPEITRRQTPRS
jgi:hypothetical protein